MWVQVLWFAAGLTLLVLLYSQQHSAFPAFSTVMLSQVVPMTILALAVCLLKHGGGAWFERGDR